MPFGITNKFNTFVLNLLLNIYSHLYDSLIKKKKN